MTTNEAAVDLDALDRLVQDLWDNGDDLSWDEWRDRILSALTASPPPALVRAVLERERQYWRTITDDWLHHNAVVVRRAWSVILGIDTRLAELAREESDGN